MPTPKKRPATESTTKRKYRLAAERSTTGQILTAFERMTFALIVQRLPPLCVGFLSPSIEPLSKLKMTEARRPTHSLAIGYACWIFGFTGAHRFYYGRQLSGTIWFFTLGLLGIGWLLDLFLMPSLNRSAARRYQSGHLDYTIGWLLLTFLGAFGIHRFYMGRYLTGIIWFCTGGLFLLGWLYDLWNLNSQIDEENRSPSVHANTAGYRQVAS